MVERDRFDVIVVVLLGMLPVVFGVYKILYGGRREEAEKELRWHDRWMSWLVDIGDREAFIRRGRLVSILLGAMSILFGVTFILDYLSHG